jgi:hypothetical protein
MPFMMGFATGYSCHPSLRHIIKPLSYTTPQDAAKEQGISANLPFSVNGNNDGSSAFRVSDLENLPVAIIGAGAAGLRVAMMLDYLGLPYEIFEASNRRGGRCFTYRFTREEDSGLKYRCYEISEQLGNEECL